MFDITYLVLKKNKRDEGGEMRTGRWMKLYAIPFSLPLSFLILFYRMCLLHCWLTPQGWDLYEIQNVHPLYDWLAFAKGVGFHIEIRHWVLKKKRIDWDCKEETYPEHVLRGLHNRQTQNVWLNTERICYCTHLPSYHSAVASQLWALPVSCMLLVLPQLAW